jgi:hypothetical protein
LFRSIQFIARPIGLFANGIRYNAARAPSAVGVRIV